MYARFFTIQSCISLPFQSLEQHVFMNNSLSCNKEWFRDWFGSRYYDLLYSHRNEAEAAQFLNLLMNQLGLPQGASVLDLACGKGRHSIHLNNLGYSVTGLDLSDCSIEEARIYTRPNLQFCTGDMRHFQLNHHFDAVVNLFTSFGYFDQTDDNLLVLRHVSQHLKPDGIFVLDYFNSEKVIDQGEQKYQLTKEGIQFSIEKKIDQDFVTKSIEVKDGLKNYHFTERVQLLRAHQLHNMLHHAGLTPANQYGSYKLEPFDAKLSDRLIIIAHHSNNS